MRGVFLALLQQQEETTGIEGAADAATEGIGRTGKETQNFLQEVNAFFDEEPGNFYGLIQQSARYVSQVKHNLLRSLLHQFL